MYRMGVPMRTTEEFSLVSMVSENPLCLLLDSWQPLRDGGFRVRGGMALLRIPGRS